MLLSGLIIVIVAILFWYSYKIGMELESITDLDMTWWYVLFIMCGCMGIIGIRYSVHKKIHAKCTQSEYWDGYKCTPILQQPIENNREKIISNLFFPRYF